VGEGWVAGIVHHATDPGDLARCIDSVSDQEPAPRGICIYDTGATPEPIRALRARRPDVHVESDRNRGYAGGANRVLAIAAERWPDADFVLLLNPDVALEPGFAAALLRACDADPGAAIASGKLLRPEGAILDSAGIRLPRHRRPRDRGSEEPDEGRFDRLEPVFAVSGAAMWIRRATLPRLALDDEIFDEDFFLYHEDTDLCWRAGRLGFRVLYVPEARARHGRRWRRDRRRRIEPWVRRHSFKNHYLQILKNERGGDLLRNLPVLVGWEVLRLGYALLRDRAVLGGYVDALRAAPSAWHKRRLLIARLRSEAVAREGG
jgi:GT2 family glycosyltransferase